LQVEYNPGLRVYCALEAAHSILKIYIYSNSSINYTGDNFVCFNIRASNFLNEYEWEEFGIQFCNVRLFK